MGVRIREHKKRKEGRILFHWVVVHILIRK